MDSLVGLGVFGTFGQPFGFQQTFYLGVDFNTSLDLDENEIEVYPGNELYAVRKEFVNGVYSISFCVYSYIKELYSDRISTFMGTCIVLQGGYVEADYIYKLLKEVHSDTLGNAQNVASNTIKVQQAQNLVVREPADFVIAKTNAIPISKTPFYSTFVDKGRKLLVRPGDNDNSSIDSKVTAFFDESLKYFGDADTMYFTLDDDVAAYAGKTGAIKVIPWSELVSNRTRQQTQTVVRTKKGIHRHHEMPDVPPPVASVANAMEPAVEEQVKFEEKIVKASYEQEKDTDSDNDHSGAFDDPNRPFDLWDEPQGVWTKGEIMYRVSEYNRLFNYTNSLLEHIYESGSNKKKKGIIRKTASPRQKSAGNKSSLRRTLFGSKRRRGLFLLVVVGLLCLCGGVYNFFFNKSNQAIVSNSLSQPVRQQEPVPVNSEQDSVKMAATDTASVQNKDTVVQAPGENDRAAIARATEQSIKSSLRKTISKTKQEIQPVPETPKALPEPYVPEDYLPVAGSTKSDTAKKRPIAKATPRTIVEQKAAEPPATAQVSVKKTVTTPNAAPLKQPSSATQLPAKSEMSAPKPKTDYSRAKELRPLPNFEITQKDIATFARSGVKNKTAQEIAKVIFESVPTNVGNVYRGQEAEYVANLLSANKQAFQKVGDDYICNSDVEVLLIPAYKSPRLPVVFPK